MVRFAGQDDGTGESAAAKRHHAKGIPPRLKTLRFLDIPACLDLCAKSYQVLAILHSDHGFSIAKKLHHSSLLSSLRLFFASGGRGQFWPGLVFGMSLELQPGQDFRNHRRDRALAGCGLDVFKALWKISVDMNLPEFPRLFCRHRDAFLMSSRHHLDRRNIIPQFLVASLIIPRMIEGILIRQIDEELARLKAARTALLRGLDQPERKKKNHISKAGIERIRRASRKRWREVKKAGRNSLAKTKARAAKT